MNEVILLPDPDWVIIKAKKYNGGVGYWYWYLIRHKHNKNDAGANSGVYQREGTSATYYSTLGEQYKCSWCNTPVPEEVQGFRNLVEWSEL